MSHRGSRALIEGSSTATSPAPGGSLAAEPIVCPYLGLVDDPRSHFAFPTAAHRCHSGARPERIESTHQAGFCLSANFPTCSRYVVPAPTALPVGPEPVDARVVAGVGESRWRNGPGGRRTVGGRAAVAVVAVLAVAIAAIWLAARGGAVGTGPGGIVAPSSTASMIAGQPSQSSSPPSPASPGVSPQPTPSSSVPPSSGPTPSPALHSPRLPTTHVVKRGETLSSIARLYGVTVQAIQKANGIKDRGLIVVGERLIIPAP